MARSSWLTNVCITLMAQLRTEYCCCEGTVCLAEHCVSVMAQFSSHYLTIVVFVFLDESVEIAEEEEQAESWVAGKYKCASSVEMFWYYHDGTHAESSWLSAVVL